MSINKQTSKQKKSMPDPNQPELITPEGLNYECTGCGKCCSGWAVPLTEEDYQRISVIDWNSLDPSLQNKKLFRPLNKQQKQNSPYTHAINATAEGQCPFLKNNLCFIHSQFDIKKKPAMCQLFPYSFNETPSGIYASVSFVSRGTIFNAGKALSDQKDYLLSKYKEFKNHFGDKSPDWSQIKLSTDIPMTWEEYLDIEKQLTIYLQDHSKSLEQRFINGCNYLSGLLNDRAGARQNKTAELCNEKNRLNQLDKSILTSLYKIYFPGQARPLGYGNLTLGAGYMANIAFSSILPDSNTIQSLEKDSKYVAAGFSYALACQLNEMPWTEERDLNDILYRFFYSHIFSKHYFGAGLGHLTLITGFHHLSILLSLIKLHAKKLAMIRGDNQVNQMDIVQTIVQLEKSLGELQITGFGAAFLELTLASPARVARILGFTL